jgi:hypothetical protein
MNVYKYKIAVTDYYTKYNNIRNLKMM